MKTFLSKVSLYIGVACLLFVMAACNNQKNGEKEDAQEKVVETRKYKDAMDREVEIPKKPQRVVALWSVGEMIVLDNKPAAAPDSLLRFYSDEEKKGIQSVGEGIEGNHEKIIELQPDLIVVYANAKKEEVEQFQKIAPTVVTQFFGEPFEMLKDMGDILDKKEEADQWIKAYETRVEEARQQMKEMKIENEKALVLHLSSKDINLFNSTVFPTIFDVYQFKLSDYQQKLEKDGPFPTQQISHEILPEFEDVDRIFVVLLDDEAKKKWSKLEQSPLWQNLPAVKKNQVYNVGNRLATKDALNLSWGLDEVGKLLKGEQ